MFDKVFSQFLTTKSMDFVWIVFLVLANDMRATQPILAGICIGASAITAVSTAYIKTKHSTTTNKEIDVE